MAVSLIFLLFHFDPRSGPMLMSADGSRTPYCTVTTVSIFPFHCLSVLLAKMQNKATYRLFFFKLEYSCFTMLCQFLLYGKVNQLYVYICPLFFGFPSHLGHHRALSRVPCAIQQVLISYLFYTQQGIYVNPNLPIYPTPLSRLGIHTFVLYFCVSISALQTGSSVPFFQVPHTCINIRYLFFSF